MKYDEIMQLIKLYLNYLLTDEISFVITNQNKDTGWFNLNVTLTSCHQERIIVAKYNTTSGLINFEGETNFEVIRIMMCIDSLISTIKNAEINQRVIDSLKREK